MCIRDSTKNECEVFSSFLKKHNFSSTIFKKKVTYRVWHSSDEASSFKEDPSFTWPLLKDATEEKTTAINADIEKLKNTLKIFEKFEIRTKLDAEDSFVTIPEVSKVFGDDEKFSIEHKDDQVLMVNFWAAW